MALRYPEAVPFVDRPEEWAVLDSAWAGAAAGGRQIVLVAGEAGAGKTRLVSEFARRRHGEGVVVLYGGCSEPPTNAYQPFAEAFDQLLAALAEAGRAEVVAEEAASLSRLVPGLSARTESFPGTPGDPDAERYRLFAASSTLFDMAATERPLLVVLEDLHWAARPTMQLLEHMARGPAPSRTCLVATFRSTPADVGAALREALPRLRRLPGATRLVISGFDRHGIRRFVEAAAGHPLHLGLERLVDFLATQTGGNPFLLGELWRHLIEAGELIRPQGPWRLARAFDDVASPEGVREVVDARLDRLPDETRDVLAAAAVLGNTFDLAVVAAAAGRSAELTLEALQPAVHAGLVEDAGPDTGRFHHALVRRSIYDRLGPAERRRRHRDAAHAVATIPGDRAAGELARHLAAAVPLVPPAEAVQAARRAAAAATLGVAYEDASRHLDAVLPFVPSDAARGELLLEAADAHMRAGHVATALAYAEEAGHLGRRVNEPTLVVAAALAYDEANWRAAGYGVTAEQLLRDALPLATDKVGRVRLSAARARALAFSGRGGEARVLADDVLAAARSLADPATLRMAFMATQFAPWTPDTLDGQVATAREFVDLARTQDDLEWEAAALDKLLYGLIVQGELDEARTVAARHHDAVRRLRQPLFQALDLQVGVLLATGQGEFDRAEALAEEADALTRFLSGSDMSGAYGVQLFTIRRLQGRLEEAAPALEAVARLGKEGATWRPALAVLRAELGRLEEAAADVRHLVADNLQAVPRDSLWWGALSYLADASVAVGDRDGAAVIHRELLPYQGLVVQVGNFLAAHGAVDRYLAILAAFLGRPDDAVVAFEAALRLETRAAMPAWIVQTQAAYARFLTDHNDRQKTARAGELLDEAETGARRMGMRTVAADAAATRQRLQEGCAPAPPAAPGRAGALTRRELVVLRLLAEGCSNRAIAERLHISQYTAANHVRAILAKTGCANRTEAAAWALRHGVAGA